MNLPKIVTNELLASLAAPDETHCMRVLVRRVMNNSPFSIRGRHRTYQAVHVPDCGCHALDVPLSVWQGDIVPGIYRENQSIAHDLQSTLAPGSLPLVFMVLPWKGAKAVAPVADVPVASQGDVFGPLAELLAKFNTPPAIVEAFKLARDGQAGALRMFVDSLDNPPSPPDPPPPPPEDMIDDTGTPPAQPEVPEKRRGRPPKRELAAAVR